MKSGLAVGVLVGIALVLGSCHRDIQNPESVREGILKYLAKRQDLTAMDVSVASVSFRRDEADAIVHFQAKNNTAANAGLDIKYVLVRNGNEWVVKGPAGMRTGANPHGDMSGAGMGTGASPALPPGHPPLTGQTSPAATK